MGYPTLFYTILLGVEVEARFGPGSAENKDGLDLGEDSWEGGGKIVGWMGASLCTLWMRGGTMTGFVFWRWVSCHSHRFLYGVLPNA